MPSVFFGVIGINLMLNGNWILAAPFVGISLAIYLIMVKGD